MNSSHFQISRCKGKLPLPYRTAKCDSATTKSIELLPRQVKDKIFDKVVERKSVDILEEFLSAY